MRKSDYILLGSTLVFAVILLIAQFLTPSASGSLSVEIDGKVAASYSLNGMDAEYMINDGTNKISIIDGEVRMTSSDCPDQICVHHKPISKNNETIVCLPNKIVLVIESADESGIDASTN